VRRYRAGEAYDQPVVVRFLLSAAVVLLVAAPVANAYDAYEGLAGRDAQVTVFAEPWGAPLKVQVVLRVDCGGTLVRAVADLGLDRGATRRALTATRSGSTSSYRASWLLEVAARLRGDRRSGLRWEGTLQGTVTPEGGAPCQLAQTRWRARPSTGALEATRDAASTSPARAWSLATPRASATGHGDETEASFVYAGPGEAGVVRLSPPAGLRVGRFTAVDSGAFRLIGVQLDRACLPREATVDILRAQLDSAGWLRSLAASFTVSCPPWLYRGRLTYRRGA
jgi:hypothetical protein